MEWLGEHTSQIEDLLNQQTPQSLTYAALRCRMALELVCYHRLRTAHEYISADDLQRWQPRDVVNRLIQDVDQRIASSYTLSISKTPLADEAKALTRSDYEKLEYVEVGRQVGFDVKRLGKIWNSLGNFLHVRMPRSSNAELTTFGKVKDIQRKVEEALEMLKELERGTMVSGGFGETVTFECCCGSKNMRRTRLLKEGQIVNCVNPECAERWTVGTDGDDISFERRTLSVTCKCGEPTHIPEKILYRLGRNQHCRFVCETCGAENFVVWKLNHAVRPETT
jgi:hypothetical protein